MHGITKRTLTQIVGKRIAKMVCKTLQDAEKKLLNGEISWKKLKEFISSHMETTK